jgi:hypothetical protein
METATVSFITRSIETRTEWRTHPLEWLRSIAAEFALTVSNGDIWRSIAIGLLLGGFCLVLGTWVARRVGFLGRDAPVVESFGVGLATGLIVLASWWAAVASGGRSAFTPVALGFAAAIGLALVRPAGPREDEPRAAAPAHTSDRAGWILAVVLGSAFVAGVALLYGSTMVLSPRDGVQPIEFMDVAFYSILGADLGRTGTETFISTSGFANVADVPAQVWYHWGELWLASLAVNLLGITSLAARSFVVLPVLLLAAATLTGTLVRRVTGTTSRGAFAFGFLACLFLAPVPLVSGPFFGDWAVGLIFGITLYGLAAVAALLAMYGLTVLTDRPATWALAGFVGTAFAVLLPAHLILALLAVVGVGAAVTAHAARSLRATGRLPAVSQLWRRTLVWTAVALLATLAWGTLTGHGLGGSGASAGVSAFNGTWRDTLLVVLVGAGAYLAIGAAWFLAHREASLEVGLYVGTIALLGAGALAWGLRLADFNMFHVFFGGLVVFGTPVAAIAAWSLWLRLRATGRRSLALVVILLCFTQIEFAASLGILRLQRFGPGNYEPVPLSLLTSIRDLPADAKVAYACQPGEEQSVWDPRLLAIGAHTDRRIVPMCFEADALRQLVGGEPTFDDISPLFVAAPQRALYPTASARPSADAVVAFMQANGIDYIYADSVHPNVLVPDATPIATDGEFELLRIP